MARGVYIGMVMKNGSRNCSRCGKELTDAASMDCGVGPICRKMDNALLARLIPSDVPAARAALYSVAMDRSQDLLSPTFTQVEFDLAVEGCDDWRTTVKRIEWILSHDLSTEDRQAYHAVVSALGYVALVAMWNGEAASGKATVRFENGRLYLKGPNNKAGRTAIKSLKGRKFHGETTEWSVPVLDTASLAAFCQVVAKHWPSTNDTSKGCNVAAPYAEAAEYLVGQTPAAKVAKAVWEIGTADGWNGKDMWVATPYNANFVSAIKVEIPWKCREWDGAAKVWRFAPQYASAVQDICAMFFPAAA